MNKGFIDDVKLLACLALFSTIVSCCSVLHHEVIELCHGTRLAPYKPTFYLAAFGNSFTMKSFQYHHFTSINAVAFTDLTPPGPCSPGICQNNGICFNRADDTAYICICTEAYTGRNCETLMSMKKMRISSLDGAISFLVGFLKILLLYDTNQFFLPIFKARCYHKSQLTFYCSLLFIIHHVFVQREVFDIDMLLYITKCVSFCCDTLQSFTLLLSNTAVFPDQHLVHQYL